MGLGTVGGFKMQIEDRDALGYARLSKATEAFLAEARKTPELGPAFSSYQINVPQLDVKVDRVKAKQQGIALTDRSEEHTSELQSLMRTSYAVFCFKKKK